MTPNGNDNVDVVGLIIFTIALSVIGLGVAIWTLIERWIKR